MTTWNAHFDQPVVTWALNPAAAFLADAARQALAVWDAWIEPDFVQTTNYGAADIQISYEPVDGSGGYWAYTNTWWDGNRDITYSTVKVDNADPGQPFFATLVHEFGHSIGLDHDTTSGSIMQSVVGNVSPNATNIADLASLYAPDSGDNLLGGSPTADIIWAGAGNDEVYGRGGNDQIWLGDGNDTVGGGAGNDEMGGGGGNDVFYAGGSGQDTIYGGTGYDIAWVDQSDVVYGVEEIHYTDLIA